MVNCMKQQKKLDKKLYKKNYYKGQDADIFGIDALKQSIICTEYTVEEKTILFFNVYIILNT